jgi:hypothetical protein
MAGLRNWIQEQSRENGTSHIGGKMKEHKTGAQFYERQCIQGETRNSHKMILHRRRQAT